jgi:hypothetical protein
MQKLSVYIGDETYHIALGRVKFILGDSMKYFSLINSIRKSFDHIENSDYAEELDQKTKVLINDSEVDTKKWRFYEINQIFDCEYELSLGSKSWMNRYIEEILSEIDYHEIIPTINSLYQDLEDIIKEHMDQLMSFDLVPKLNEINAKMILKNLRYELSKDEVSASSYDLNYNDLILWKLNMAYYLAKRKPLVHHLVLVNIPIITDEIMSFLKNTNFDTNLSFLILEYQEKYPGSLEQVYYLKHESIDFADEVSIYNSILIDYPKKLSMDEFKEIAHAYFSGESTEETKILHQILVK